MESSSSLTATVAFGRSGRPDTVRYAGNLARARDSTAYSLGWPDPDAIAGASSTVGGPVNWTLLLIALMSAALWTWFARAVHRYDPDPIGIASAGAPRGIGGWLIFPGLAVIATRMLVVRLSSKWTCGPYHLDIADLHGGDHYDPLWARYVVQGDEHWPGGVPICFHLFVTRRPHAARVHRIPHVHIVSLWSTS